MITSATAVAITFTVFSHLASSVPKRYHLYSSYSLVRSSIAPGVLLMLLSTYFSILAAYLMIKIAHAYLLFSICTPHNNLISVCDDDSKHLMFACLLQTLHVQK